MQCGGPVRWLNQFSFSSTVRWPEFKSLKPTWRPVWGVSVLTQPMRSRGWRWRALASRPSPVDEFQVQYLKSRNWREIKERIYTMKTDRSHSTWVNGSAGSKGLDLQDSSLCFQEQKDSGHSVETEGSSSGARSSPEGLSQETRFSHWLSGQASGRSSKRIKPKLWRHCKNRGNYILKCNFLPLHNTLLLVPVAMKFIILPFRALLKRFCSQPWLLLHWCWHVFMCSGIHTCARRWSTVCGNWSSLFLMWVLGTEVKLSGLSTSTFTHGAISPALTFKHEAYVCTRTHVRTLTTCVLVPEGTRQGHHIFCSWSCR